MRVAIVGVLAFAVLLSSSLGCAMGQKKVEKQLASPAAVDCGTAEGDIRMLQSEKAHVAQRMLEGVTAIIPASLVVGIVTRTEGTKFRVATGEYNKQIDARIAEIKSTCKL